MTYHETRICRDCRADFTVRAETHRVRCDACRDAVKAKAEARRVEAVRDRYRDRFVAAKLAAYAARKAGDAEAAAAATADVIHYREAMERAV